jgi:hypothetical protein
MAPTGMDATSVLFPRVDDGSGMNMGAQTSLSYRTSLVVIVFLALGIYNATEVFIKVLISLVASTTSSNFTHLSHNQAPICTVSSATGRLTVM